MTNYRHTDGAFIDEYGKAMLIMSAIIQKYCNGSVEITQEGVNAVGYSTLMESWNEELTLKLDVLTKPANLS